MCVCVCRFFASASAPSVEEFLLGDGHLNLVEEAYPWETAANPVAALQARKKELLSKGTTAVHTVLSLH